MTKIYKQTSSADAPAGAQYGDIIIKKTGIIQSVDSENNIVDPIIPPKSNQAICVATDKIISSSANNMEGVGNLQATIYPNFARIRGKFRITQNTSPTSIFTYGVNVQKIIEKLPELSAAIPTGATLSWDRYGFLDLTSSTNSTDSYDLTSKDAGVMSVLDLNISDPATGVLWGRPGRLIDTTGSTGAWAQTNPPNGVGMRWSFEFNISW